MTQSRTQTIAPAQLRELMTSGAEFALIDPREVGEYSERHLFFASCLPLSRMEPLLATRLPRRDVPVVLVSGGEHDADVAQRAAAVLTAAGYTRVSMLAGGTDAWEAAGGEVFGGVNVPSKAFGEFVEHWFDTPRLPASELARRQAAGDNLVVLDSRPLDEFQRMSIPGGVDCPGAELVYRAQQAAPDPATTIVVNCAGRTRSIIGAQSLINAGVPNPVFALKDGTMGWKLAGLDLRHGETAAVADPAPEVVRQAAERAQAVARQCGVEPIDAAGLASWQSDPARTTYLLDVRTEAEFLAGHWPGAIHAPGGQLVQATDEYVMVRQARLVLCDSADGVRSAMTAHWLLQLGWPDVRVLTAPPERAEAGSGRIPVALHGEVAVLDPAQAVAGLPGGAQVLDLSSSRQYRQAHLPGAMWALRARLADCLDKARALRPGTQSWVVMGDDEDIARLAANDLIALAPGDKVSLLPCGETGWRAAGGDLTRDDAVYLTGVDDVWPRPGEGKVDPRAAMEQYLSWELGLVEQVEREGLANFRRLIGS